MGPPDFVSGMVKRHYPGRVRSLHSSSNSRTSWWHMGNSIQHTNSLFTSGFLGLTLPHDRKLQLQRHVSKSLDS